MFVCVGVGLWSVGVCVGVCVYWVRCQNYVGSDSSEVPDEGNFNCSAFTIFRLS